MVKTIETRAVISAQDRTGATFARIAQQLKHVEDVARRGATLNMRVKGMQHVAATAKRVAMIEEGRRRAGAGAVVAGTVKGAAGIAGAIGAYQGVKASIKSHANLETALTDLGKTTDASDAQLAEVRGKFQRLAPTLGVTGKELASVAQSLAAGGLGFDEAVKAAPVVVKSAKAAQASMDDVSGAAVSLMQNLGVNVENLQSGLENIYKGGKLGRFELRDAARDLPEIASKAATLGYKGTKGAASIAAQAKIVRDTTGSSAETKTNLSALYSYIATPEFKKNLAKVGLDRDRLYKDAVAKGEVPLDRILDAMRKKGLDKDPLRLGQAITSDEARKAALPLLQNDYRPLRDQILREAPGSIDVDFQRTLQTTQGSLDKFSGALDSAGASVGEAFAPAVAHAADAMTGLAAWMLESKDAIKENLAKKLGSDLSASAPPSIVGPFERDPSYGSRLQLRRPPSFTSLPLPSDRPSYAPPSRGGAPVPGLGNVSGGAFGLSGPVPSAAPPPPLPGGYPQGRPAPIAAPPPAGQGVAVPRMPAEPQKVSVESNVSVDVAGGVQGTATIEGRFAPLQVTVSLDSASIRREIQVEVGKATAALRGTIAGSAGGVGSVGKTMAGPGSQGTGER